MRVNKLKIIESTNNQFNDIVLNLVRSGEMEYKCFKNNIQVIDTHNEIEQMNKEYQNTGSMIFWDLHLMIQLENKIIWINKVRLNNE